MGKDETELVPTSYLQCFLLRWGLPQGRWWTVKKLRRLRWQRGVGVSGCRRIGVGLGKIAKFLTQMGAAAGRRGAIKKLGVEVLNVKRVS